MRIELTDLHAGLDATIIYVTHDQVEAMIMADKIVVLNAGEIEQVGSPMELYQHPATPFVTSFIDSPKMNLIEGDVARANNCKIFGIRPEHLALSTSTGEWEGSVRHIERLGADTIVHLESLHTGPLLARVPGDADYKPGQSVWATPDQEKVVRF